MPDKKARRGNSTPRPTVVLFVARRASLSYILAPAIQRPCTIKPVEKPATPMEGAMSTSQYRLTVVICAAVWFLIGMHSPVVHEIVDHGRIPHWPLLTILAVLILLGCATLWSLLRRAGGRV